MRMGTPLLALMACPSPDSVQEPAGGEIDPVQAWRDFTQELERAGVEFLTDRPQPEAIDSANGL